MSVLLDISRTIARARLPQPTGIDRVERAYIRWALEKSEAIYIARVDGMLYLLPREAVALLLSWLDGAGRAPRLDLRGRLQFQRPVALRKAQAHVRRHSIARCHPRQVADMLRGAGLNAGVYLNTGHDNLDPVTFRQIGQAGLRQIALLHDTIPLDHPDYARAGTPARFREKFDTAMIGAAVIANSGFTAARISHHAGASAPPVHVLHLGLDPAQSHRKTELAEPASFIVLGTIEPRKNIPMLLEVWRRLTDELGDTAPRLHIIGRRGWDIRDLVHVLEKDPMMNRTVFEHGALDDAQTKTILATSRALLFPSRVEGFGLPLAEALQAGVPVLASDIPALREVGGAVPEWLPADDPDAWRAAILAYATPNARERTAQLTRLAGWQAPTWETHFQALENLMETILVQPLPHR